jgi:hypothetical protein
MNKKGYGKRVLYIDLDWINKRFWQKGGNGSRLASLDEHKRFQQKGDGSRA